MVAVLRRSLTPLRLILLCFAALLVGPAVGAGNWNIALPEGGNAWSTAQIEFPAVRADRYAKVIWKREPWKMQTAANTAYFGDQLFEGDAVITGAGGSLAMEFPDGARLVVEPNSTVVIATLGGDQQVGKPDVVIRLLRGRLESEVPPQSSQRYRILTLAGDATAGVGRFRIGTSDDHIAMLSEVLTGEVTVTSGGGHQNVAATFGTRAEIGKPPGPARPLPAAPDLAGLPEHALAAAPLPLRWTPSAKAHGYRAQLAGDRQFTMLTQDTVVVEAKLTLPGMPPGDYFVRVRKRDEAGLEGIDAVHRVSVTNAPDAPSPVAPDDNARIARLALWLAWAPTPQSHAYRLQVASDQGFSQKLVDTSSITTRYELGAEFPNGMYFWRVAGVAAGGLTGSFSAPRRFEVGEEQLVKK